MKKTREQKGITLIALIITIVVLLILAVVAINSITNDGLITKAEEATNKYNESVQNEADQLKNYLDYLNEHSGPKTYTAYTVGQEVKLKDQSKETGTFYVLTNSDETQEMVTLLTKECINTGSLTQGNADEVPFSTEVYWSTTGTINEPSEIPTTHKAAYAAYRYGSKIGGTGRLITEDERDALWNAFNWAMNVSGWTSHCKYFDDTTYGEHLITYMDGTRTGDSMIYFRTSYVQPVVVISKDLITLVTE